MIIQTEGVVGGEILLRFQDETQSRLYTNMWLKPKDAEGLIFQLQNFLHEQNNHLDAEQRAQE